MCFAARRGGRRSLGDTAKPHSLSAKHPIVGRERRAQRFGMPTFPAVALLAVVILLGLLAACHFFQGRRHKNHASRKGPDE